MALKTINFIYTKNKLDFKKYSKNTDYDSVISYHDIITKLIKNDSSNDKPSPIVINSYLRKKIITSISDENISHILYALSEIDIEIIKNIIELISKYMDINDLHCSLFVIKNKKLDIDINEFKNSSDFEFMNLIKEIEV